MTCRLEGVDLNTPAATITGNWVLSTKNAHLAFDNILVTRGSSTSEISRSAVITLAPTPAANPEQLVRRARELPVKNITTPPKRTYDRAICRFHEYRHIISTSECVPVYANITGPNTYEEFHSWLSKFGWRGKPEGLASSDTTSTGTSPRFDISGLQLLDIPQLMDISRMHRLNWGRPDPPASPSNTYCPSGLNCSEESNEYFGNLMQRGRTSNLSDFKSRSSNKEFSLAICFFSGPIPQLAADNSVAFPLEFSDEIGETKYENCNDTIKAHAVVVTYMWMEDTVSANERLRQAIVEMEPQLADCEIENEIPEMAIQPPRVLRPIAAEEFTKPDVAKWRQNPIPAAVPVDPVPDGSGSALGPITGRERPETARRRHSETTITSRRPRQWNRRGQSQRRTAR
jgi:hypothetical protein